MSKVLFVEDDVALGASAKEWLEDEEGLKIEWVTCGEDALQLLQGFGFDLIILDWELPGISGLDVCQQYRRDGGQAPILFLTGRGEMTDKQAGFSLGADDYLTKPYDVRELSMRCKALLRRARETTRLEVSDRGVCLRPEEKVLLVDGTPLPLTTLECALLKFLISHPGQVFSAAELLRAVWPSQKETGEEAVRSLIRGLRKKLAQLENEFARDLIRTDGRSGYKYTP